MTLPRSFPPPLHEIHETVLYGKDLDAAVRFYQSALGLPLVQDGRPLMLTFRITSKPGQVLLIFNTEIASVQGRPVPSHGCTGAGHIALRIEPRDEGAWTAQLESHNIEIEQVVEWDNNRGRSIYFRDPAGNSIELVNADIWAG